MAASIKIPAIFTARDRFSPSVKRMNASVQIFANKASTGIARVEYRFNRLMRPITAVQRQLGAFGLGIGLFAMIGIIGGVVNIFKEFEQANANVASVLGKTTSQTKDLQEDAKRLGATTAFTASQVAGLQTEYAKLGFSQSDILNATEATLDLAAAAGTELSNAASIAGGTVSGFAYKTEETARVVDVMAKSFSTSALDIEKFSESMKYVAPVAANANMDIEETTSLLGVLANNMIDGSMAGTALRRIINEAASSGKSFSKFLEDASEGGLSLAKAEKLVGKNAQTALVVLAKNQEKIKELNDAYQNAGGSAKEMADKQLDTLNGSITKLTSAYEGFILSLDDGTGSMSGFIRNVIDVTTEVLSLMSGVAAAKETLEGKSLAIRESAETALFLLKALGYLIGVIIAFKALLVASKIALFAYNVALGINTAITQTNKRALITNTVAQGAYRTAMAISTVATWLANSAFVALAISVIAATWPILAIIAAVVAVVYIFLYWDEIVAWFGARFEEFTSWIIKMWAKIVVFFQNFSFEDFFRSIGDSIVSFLLIPLKSALWLISKMPGKLGDLGQLGLDKINDLQAGISFQNEDIEPLPTTNQASNQQLAESVSNSNVNLNIRDKGDNVQTVEQDDNINVKLSQGIGVFALQ